MRKRFFSFNKASKVLAPLSYASGKRPSVLIFSDSRRNGTEAWMKRLRIIDSFMLAPANYNRGEIVAMDRAYVNYGKSSS